MVQSVVLVALVAPLAGAAPKDFLVGAVWEFRLDTKAKDDPTVRFRTTPDGKVFNRAAEEVGTWTGSEDKAEMKVTGLAGPNAGFNGTYTLTLVSNPGAPPRWNGRVVFANNGKSRAVGVKLIRD